MKSQMLLTITISAASFALLSFITSMMLLAKTRRLSRAVNLVESQLDAELASLSQDLDTSSCKSAEHGRRIAWLETRVRAASSEKKRVEATVSTINSRPTITERRHRVLALARRGQDPQTIAHTLGMPHGEVELMINLGRAA